jgi:hypothetical protein
MVSWASKADRGGRSPIRARARGGGRQSKLRADMEKTPQPTQDPKPAAPRGSPIANKLVRHAAQAWTSIPIPYRAVHVRTSSPPHLVSPDNLPAPMQAARDTSLAILHYGTTVSHRRWLVPRAGSPSYWFPRLTVHPSVHETTTDPLGFCHSDPQAEQCSRSTAKPIPLPRGSGSHPTTEGRLPP